MNLNHETSAEPEPRNLQPATNCPEPAPCNESSEPSTSNLQLETRFAYRANGKVARLSKPVRDQINHWLLDGVSIPTSSSGSATTAKTSWRSEERGHAATGQKNLHLSMVIYTCLRLKREHYWRAFASIRGSPPSRLPVAPGRGTSRPVALIRG